MQSSFLNEKAKDAIAVVETLDEEITLLKTTFYAKSHGLNYEKIKPRIAMGVLGILLVLGVSVLMFLYPVRGYMELSGFKASHYTFILAGLAFIFFLIVQLMIEKKLLPFYKNVSSNLEKIDLLSSKIKKYKEEFLMQDDFGGLETKSEITINRSDYESLEQIKNASAFLKIENDEKLSKFAEYALYFSAYLMSLTVCDLLCGLLRSHTGVYPGLLLVLLICSAVLGPTAVGFFFMKRKRLGISINSALWVLLGSVAGFLVSTPVVFIIYGIIALIIFLVKAIVSFIIKLVITIAIIFFIVAFIGGLLD